MSAPPRLPDRPHVGQMPDARAMLEERVEQMLERTGAGAVKFDRTMRWGGEQQFEFVQQNPAPADNLYFSSQLLARADEPMPRTWSAIMQCSFELFSEFAVSTVWTVQFSLFIGVGQTNVRMDKFATINPATGAVQVDNGTPAVQQAFNQTQTVQVFWPAFPARAINAQLFLYSNQAGSPAFFTGKASALLAPYIPSDG
jgi:hypothetical protein